MFAETRVSIGIGLGGYGAGFYQPPPSYASYMPPSPGPDYDWVDGYWSQNHGRNAWVSGYWNRRLFRSHQTLAPRFDNRFNDRDYRPDYNHDYRPDYNRNFNRQDRNQNREFDRDQSPNRYRSDRTGYR